MDKQSSNDRSEKQSDEASETKQDDRAPAKQEEPGTGGLAKAKYDKAIEKAVKDVHG